MKIVIVGVGKLGLSLAKQLSREGHDIVAVDQSEAALKLATDTLDINCLCGNGVDQQVQIEAGVPDSDLLIAVTTTDAQNILICMVAKKLGVKHTIARVRGPEYAKSLLTIRDEMGLSLSINPEQSAATEVSRILRFPSAMKVDFFGKGRVEMVEIKVGAGSRLIGHPLSTIYDRFHVRVLVCAVQRGDTVCIPRGDFVPEEGDLISLTATPTGILQFFREIGLTAQKTRSVMLVGAGKITYYLTRMLLDAGMQVQVLDKSRARCEEFAEWFPKAMVICGDGTDRELLKEEGIDDVDALVALTGLDEENVVISMYASACGVNKVITKINHITFGEVLTKAGIECVITPHVVATGRILRYVRAMNRTTGGSMEALSKIVNDRVEAIEFKVRDGFRGAGKPLHELHLKKGLLIASILRSGRIILPSGDDCIQPGDNVVVVAVNSGLEELNDILA